ncbi:unnamed protein product [Vitrella brassicaformis CCMP3155]|uniref:Ubiquitin-like domain-containing protein n=2 Tax=Vitrella brassicaformis TaxID=1169539 RepID=A0A0G4EA68_VITBC|nr:unnamed protein product [Vitrella brassicaformis CCMP3155]|eukprot:CEL92117.1 unnamed protein product [Vitrella brassicaformis CCMP3155]
MDKSMEGTDVPPAGASKSFSKSFSRQHTRQKVAAAAATSVAATVHLPGDGRQIDLEAELEETVLSFKGRLLALWQQNAPPAPEVPKGRLVLMEGSAGTFLPNKAKIKESGLPPGAAHVHLYIVESPPLPPLVLFLTNAHTAQTVALEMCFHDSIADVKQQLSQHMAIAVENQTLICEGEELPNERRLRDCYLGIEAVPNRRAHQAASKAKAGEGGQEGGSGDQSGVYGGAVGGVQAPLACHSHVYVLDRNDAGDPDPPPAEVE